MMSAPGGFSSGSVILATDATLKAPGGHAETSPGSGHLIPVFQISSDSASYIKAANVTSELGRLINCENSLLTTNRLGPSSPMDRQCRAFLPARSGAANTS